MNDYGDKSVTIIALYIKNNIHNSRGSQSTIYLQLFTQYIIIQMKFKSKFDEYS